MARTARPRPSALYGWPPGPDLAEPSQVGLARFEPHPPCGRPASLLGARPPSAENAHQQQRPPIFVLASTWWELYLQLVLASCQKRPLGLLAAGDHPPCWKWWWPPGSPAGSLSGLAGPCTVRHGPGTILCTRSGAAISEARCHHGPHGAGQPLATARTTPSRLHHQHAVGSSRSGIVGELFLRLGMLGLGTVVLTAVDVLRGRGGPSAWRRRLEHRGPSSASRIPSPCGPLTLILKHGEKVISARQDYRSRRLLPVPTAGLLLSAAQSTHTRQVRGRPPAREAREDQAYRSPPQGLRPGRAMSAAAVRSSRWMATNCSASGRRPRRLGLAAALRRTSRPLASRAQHGAASGSLPVAHHGLGARLQSLLVDEESGVRVNDRPADSPGPRYCSSPPAAA